MSQILGGLTPKMTDQISAAVLKEELPSKLGEEVLGGTNDGRNYLITFQY